MTSSARSKSAAKTLSDAELAERVCKAMLDATKDHNEAEQKQLIATAELCAKILISN